MKKQEQRIAEIIGEASMCWSKAPTGVFDSVKASKLVDDVMCVLTESIEGERRRILERSAECFHPYCDEPPCFEKLEKILKEL